MHQNRAVLMIAAVGSSGAMAAVVVMRCAKSSGHTVCQALARRPVTGWVKFFWPQAPYRENHFDCEVEAWLRRDDDGYYLLITPHAKGCLMGEEKEGGGDSTQDDGEKKRVEDVRVTGM